MFSLYDLRLVIFEDQKPVERLTMTLLRRRGKEFRVGAENSGKVNVCEGIAVTDGAHVREMLNNPSDAHLNESNGEIGEIILSQIVSEEVYLQRYKYDVLKTLLI